MSGHLVLWCIIIFCWLFIGLISRLPKEVISETKTFLSKYSGLDGFYLPQSKKQAHRCLGPKFKLYINNHSGAKRGGGGRRDGEQDKRYNKMRIERLTGKDYKKPLKVIQKHCTFFV